MKRFIIKELKICGPGKEDGIVYFDDGLNIIQGRSNTGKTWILRSINYIFGSDTLPFSKETGYNKICMIIETDQFGPISFSRILGQKIVDVNTASEKIESGVYKTDYTLRGPLYLNDLWMSIIGSETVNIPKNTRYEKERISWRNLMRVFLLDEGEVSGTRSIILPQEKTQETALISSLIYLLSGNNYADEEEIVDSKVLNAGKKAILNYIEEQLDLDEDRRLELEEKLKMYINDNIEEKAQEIANNIQEKQMQLNDALVENQILTQQLSEIQGSITANKILFDRYEALVSQYKADLQRLNFVSKGEKTISQIDHNDLCPFCGSALENHNEDHHIAIIAEVKRIASELAVITATQESLKEEIEKAELEESEIQSRRKKINAVISKEQETINNFNTALDAFRNYTEIKQELALLSCRKKELSERKIKEKSKKYVKRDFFHAKNYFSDIVGDRFDKLLSKILKQCNYPGYENVHFNFDDFDIEINKIKKAENEGKGFRSFLNSATALMLFEFFNRNNVAYPIGFLMIDTPLLGLDEAEHNIDKESIRDGLYRTFIEYQHFGQIIIADNMNSIPNTIDFSKEKVNIISFHKVEKDNYRYGLLPDWRKDIFQTENENNNSGDDNHE